MASGAPAAPAVQTVVLRVSIHCHGCKKKVRKVLKSIEGVQNVTVDASQHKVTVTGTVDANTLVQRLHKSGKKGVPWNCHEPANKTEAAAPAKAPAPEAPPAPAEKKPAGDGGKDAAAAPAAKAADKKPEEAAVKEPKAESSEKKKPELEKKAEEKVEAKKAEEEVEAKKAEEKVEAKKDAEPKAKGAEPPAKEKVEAKKTEEKVETKKDAEPPKAKAAEPPAKEEAKAEAAAAKDKDEAKKAEKPKDAVKPEPVAVTSERSLSMPAPAAPPKHAYYEEYGYRHPYNNYSPAPQPVMSYHAAQPSASVSYYAPQPQAAYSMQQQPPPEYSSYQQQTQQGMRQWSPSYLYMPYPHATPEPYHHDYYSPPGMHAPPPMPMQDSYRIFDDENPNSCSVM